MIRAPKPPDDKGVLTSPALLERTADKHGVPVVIVNGHFACVTYRPNGQRVLWEALVPAGERVA